MTAFHLMQGIVPVAGLVIAMRQWRRIASFEGAVRGSRMVDASDAVAELERGAAGGAYALRVLGRIASPLALVGAIVEMGRGLGGGAGLVALQRGLAERIAVERAGIGIGIGIATAFLSFGMASALLRRSARARSGLRARTRAAALDPSDPEV